jgi:hypothetical protein
VALVAIIAVVWHTGGVTSGTRTRVDETARVLDELRRAIRANDGFRPTVGTNPIALSQLVRPLWNDPVDAGSLPVNSCGVPFTDAQVQNWNKAGPFVPFYISTAGLRLPIGVIADTLRRTRDSAQHTKLEMVIREVSDRQARLLDSAIDGGDGARAGALRWVPNDSDTHVLYDLGAVSAC